MALYVIRQHTLLYGKHTICEKVSNFVHPPFCVLSYLNWSYLKCQSQLSGGKIVVELSTHSEHCMYQTVAVDSTSTDRTCFFLLVHLHIKGPTVLLQTYFGI